MPTTRAEHCDATRRAATETGGAEYGAKNFARAEPAAAKKRAMPNSRKQFVFTGMCQTCGGCCPCGKDQRDDKGPPASQPEGLRQPGSGLGACQARSRVMPMKKGTKWVSFSSLSELPRAAAALSRSPSRPTIAACRRTAGAGSGTADISISARVTRVRRRRSDRRGRVRPRSCRGLRDGHDHARKVMLLSERTSLHRASETRSN